MNRLAHEASPYLRQHADNPVDWYAWGDEAFAEARAHDKPVLLSVGYSSCHWCHVMEHESFEDDATARLMNEWFVNIKVDREERPDVDDIYMNAVQSFTGGHGGWPMTVFLLPDGRPFYGGTYYPSQPRYGMPSFRQVLEAVHDAYRNKRGDVEQVAAQVAQGLARTSLGIAPDADSLTANLLDRALDKMRGQYDSVHGGFGGAPKFPQPMNIEMLLRQWKRTGSAEALGMATRTLRKMAHGGIYDQIGGGFHRYSVDAQWLVPHFEKMLYDNAQLSAVYLHAYLATGDAFFLRIATEIYDYVLREMTSPEGGFYSATDADSEGEEGRYFVWSIAEMRDLLGDDADRVIAYYGASERGNFEGHNILYVPDAHADDAAAAQVLHTTPEALRAVLERARDRLFAARAQRVPPGLDDKVIASWNGMMLASLAEAARVLGSAEYYDAAVRAGTFIREKLLDGDRLRRIYAGGTARIGGYLDDYAHVASAFLALYQLTFDTRWFADAQRLAETMLRHFRAEDGGFYDSPDDGEALIARPRNLQDNAVPAPSSMAAYVLLRLAAYTGRAEYDHAARQTVAMVHAAMREYPQAFGHALAVVDLLVSGIDEVAIIGPEADPRTLALLAVVSHAYRPNTVTAHAAGDVAGEHPIIPLLSARMMRDGAPTAYVCRHFACQMPVTAPDALAAQLDGGRAQPGA